MLDTSLTKWQAAYSFVLARGGPLLDSPTIPLYHSGKFDEADLAVVVLVYLLCLPSPSSHFCGRLLLHRTVRSNFESIPLLHGTTHCHQTSSAPFRRLQQIRMILTVFEHLVSCHSCNKAVLVEDPSATRSTLTVAGDLVGLVIRHGTRESPDSVSSLAPFPFTAIANPDLPPQWGTREPCASSVCRQVICMEHCGTPESRRQISRKWGLRWLNFEQHFETIAAWSGRKLGECPCECHRWDHGAVDNGVGSEGDECTSIDTTLALVGQQRGRYLKEPSHPRIGHEVDQPNGSPSEGRKRVRSEEISQTDQYILSWREQCRRASN